MSTAVSAERRAIIQTVREFCQAEIRPNVMRWDEAQEFPREVFRKLGELGFLGVLFAEEYGGAALSYMDYQAIIEEIAAADPSVALSVAAHNSLGSNHVYQFGTDAQKRKYMPRLTSRRVDRGVGADRSGGRLRCERHEDDRRPRRGFLGPERLEELHHARVGRQPIAVLMAVTDRAKGNKGISAFIVELDNPGIRVGKKENKLGMRASDTCTLVMEDCRVPSGNLLGTPGSGWVDSMKVLDGGRIAIAALSVGLARGAYDAALAYSRERRQFGKPICEFEAIQFYLAEMATDIDAARVLTERAAAAKDAGESVTRLSAKAKLFASEMAVRVTERAIQIHGGYGFIKDFPVEKYFRDVKLCTIGEGTSEIQKLVIARQLLGKA